MAAAILKAQPITFDYRDGEKDVLGFSAEQLHAIDAHLVNVDATGRPDSIRPAAMFAHIIAALQEFDRRLAALETATNNQQPERT